MTKPLTSELMMLDLSLMAAKLTLRESPAPLEDRLRWFAGEMERLAGEAYNLADAASELSSPSQPDGRKPA